VAPSGDPLAVQDVLARYAAGIDDQDWERYRLCFTEDAEFPGFRDEPILGIDAWMRFVRETLEPYRATQHLIGVPLVEITDDLATARTSLQARHFYREPSGRIFTLWGVYRSELVRSAGVWRLRRHALDVQAMRTRDG
jgi:3-phenylpropionate/cinnamic acid dioxygenase small subunit